MATGALQDITNIKSSNFKLVIKKEEKQCRREILQPFLVYSDSFYKHADKPVVGTEIELIAGYSHGVSLDMRRTLLEWMYDVKEDFSLSTVTYQQAVRILDVYVAKAGTAKSTFQLAGAVALSIAHKANECKEVQVQFFIDVCDGAYTRDEFLAMEKQMLLTLKFSLTYLLPMQVIKEDHFGLGNSLCAYASEAVLLSTKYVSMLPTELAAYIEENVLSLLSKHVAEPRFMAMLREVSSLVDYQPKCIREFLGRAAHGQF
ncbi:G2/mitotic-specific cyclin-B3 [Nematocida sp. AWRm77]|nr:G2/mitotic-specific cyclin-B3 [Nematocida sp. AWRm77]